MLPQHIGAAPRGLAVQEVRRGQGAGIKVGLVHIQPHPGQLLLELLGGVLAGVGEEQVIFLLLRQPLDEFPHARQDLVPVVDHAVHVADEALLLSQLFHGPLLSLQGPGALCNMGLRSPRVSHIPVDLSKEIRKSFPSAGVPAFGEFVEIARNPQGSSVNFQKPENAH